MRRTPNARLIITVLLGTTFLVPMTAGSATAGGGCYQPTTEGRGTVVTMSEQCFGPAILRVDTGSKVTWVNKDPVAHNVIGHGVAWGSGPDLQPGDRFSEVFRKPGAYAYACWIHPGMTGLVVVGHAGVPPSGGDTATAVEAASTDSSAAKPPAGGSALPTRTVATVSAGAWPAVSAAGFALAFMLGLVVILLWRRIARPAGDRGPGA
jgi:plastocyanin